MPQVIAETHHTYAGVSRKPGDRYEAEEKFLPLITKMGWAKLAALLPSPGSSAATRIAATPAPITNAPRLPPPSAPSRIRIPSRQARRSRGEPK